MCGEGVSTGLVLGLAGWRAGEGVSRGPRVEPCLAPCEENLPNSGRACVGSDETRGSQPQPVAPPGRPNCRLFLAVMPARAGTCISGAQPPLPCLRCSPPPGWLLTTLLLRAGALAAPSSCHDASMRLSGAARAGCQPAPWLSGRGGRGKRAVGRPREIEVHPLALRRVRAASGPRRTVAAGPAGQFLGASRLFDCSHQQHARWL